MDGGRPIAGPIVDFLVWIIGFDGWWAPSGEAESLSAEVMADEPQRL